MKKSIAIIGLGWLGQPVAIRLIELGYSVKGSVTSVEKAKHLREHGFETYPVEISESGIKGEIGTLLTDVDRIIIMIPPGLRKNTGADFVLKMVHLQREIRKYKVSKIILVSSTSVYDDSQGVVTEKDGPKPQTIAGKQLLQVEELFQNSEELKTAVVRFGGLIGGSREPARWLAGRTELMDGNAPVNLIHRRDCVNILVEIIKRDAFGKVFNAVNPQHPKKSDYYIEKTKELGLEAPSFVNGDADEIFKQVESENLKSVLDYEFKTPLL